MENQKEHFRHILLFYFRKGKNASQAHKKLCAVYGDEALKERQCQNWFAKFRSGDFSLKDEKRKTKELPTLNSYHPTERLILLSTLNN